jgi:hypothetical protein
LTNRGQGIPGTPADIAQCTARAFAHFSQRISSAFANIG